MRVNVIDILNNETGYSRSFVIDNETPEMESVHLTKPLSGEFIMTRTEEGIQVKGQLSTEIELECHRCLDAFKHEVNLRFSQEYRENPGDDEMPIVGRQIDLTPLIEQEIIVSLPIMQLCQADCAGITAPPKSEPKSKKG